MKTKHCLALVALSALACALSPAAFGQGSLTPPAGPPMASMKTLDQVEARIPLVAGQAGVSISEAGTITISQPGSYYLTRNITITTDVNGIEINADATVDLNGYSIIGTTASLTTGSAVSLGDYHIVLKNGIIKGGTVVENVATPSVTAGFRHGVYAATTTGRTIHISDLTVSGVRQTGILVPRVGRVERCNVTSCGGAGIVMFFRNGTVEDCFVENCSGKAGADPVGIKAHTVRNCSARILAAFDDTADQPTAIDATKVENCTGIADTLYFGAGQVPTGINARVVSYSVGKGAHAISSLIAVACVSEGGGISGTKHLAGP